MPTKPPRYCPGCRDLVLEPGPCPVCHPPWVGATRPSGGRPARRRRKRMLAANPLCNVAGCFRLATIDDHIVGWAEAQSQGWTRQRWDHPSNHQGLCKPHHDRKTAAESRHRPPPF